MSMVKSISYQHILVHTTCTESVHKLFFMYMEVHIKDKRDEIIWALSLQNYTDKQIASMFNVDRSTIYRIIKQRPRGWKPKWVKVV